MAELVICPECGAETERTYIRTSCSQCGASLKGAVPVGAPPLPETTLGAPELPSVGLDAAPPTSLDLAPASPPSVDFAPAPPTEFAPTPLPPEPESAAQPPAPEEPAPGSAGPRVHVVAPTVEASQVWTAAMEMVDAVRGEEEPVECPLGPAPRRVPMLLRAQLKCGGVIPGMGWFFVAFGSLFVWIFGSMADLSFITMAGPRATAEATVTSNERTNISEGDDDSSTPIWATHYTFGASDGSRHEGVSFAPGRYLEPGERARVEYLERNPRMSRIEGMRHRPLPAVVLLVLIFPLLGLCFALSGLLAGSRAIRVLRNGQPTHGVLIGMETTGAEINNRPVMKMTFRFTADDGHAYSAVAKTHETGLLTDSRRELLVYDPANPSRAVLFDSLPGRPRIGPDGELQVRSPVAAFFSLLLALIGFTSMAAWALHMLKP